MLTNVLQSWTRTQMRRLATIFVKTPITPNMLTICGLFLNIGVGLVLAAGHLALGGVLILVAGLFDLLDGALARITDRMTAFGGFLDSSLDRYSEGVIYMGLLWWVLQGGRTIEAMLILAVIIGSMMISYVRARATPLNVDCEVGLMARSERIGLLALALIVSHWLPAALTWALWLLTIGTQITTVQRIVHVYQHTDGAKKA
ncbi:MAG: CDP-alcohol phosphatidyltransferase family protein [Ktedonobacterales bacterium]|nr:CDP-alcohol phosphatidyltransferase family protein [Ktedonobacterales bacterium]